MDFAVKATKNRCRCPGCDSTNGTSFFVLEQVPLSVCVQWPTRIQALDCRRGDIELRWCRNCGLIWNNRFDPELLNYTPQYENSLLFSNIYRKYTENIIDHLSERYSLNSSRIAEIGSGKGEFLSMFCQRTDSTGLGFDPSYEPPERKNPRFKIIRDYWHSDYSLGQPDILCLRHVLEHIDKPDQLLEKIRSRLDDTLNTLMFLEVPSVRPILENISLGDIIYEHCNYFSIESLGSLLSRVGFAIADIRETYQRQFIVVEAFGDHKFAHSVTPNIGNLEKQISRFKRKSRIEIEQWSQKIKSLANYRTVLWGAGAKGVTLLNILGQANNNGQIEFVVDINPRKHGKFIAGTGQRIVPPEFLKDYQPDAVLPANPIYRNEIAARLKNLSSDAQLV